MYIHNFCVKTYKGLPLIIYKYILILTNIQKKKKKNRRQVQFSRYYNIYIGNN